MGFSVSLVKRAERKSVENLTCNLSASSAYILVSVKGTTLLVELTLPASSLRPFVSSYSLPSVLRRAEFISFGNCLTARSKYAKTARKLHYYTG